MKREAQRIAIAEACGWQKTGHTAFAWQHGDEIAEAAFHLPDYLNDLNAMHEAEIAIIYPRDKAMIYHKYLMELCKTGPYCFSATAAQRAEAFLRTLNLWKE